MSLKKRGPALMVDWFPDTLPESASVEPAALRTRDGASVSGLLYRGAQSHAVVCLMHPREFFGFHYLVPALLEAGFAVWTQSARSVGNDLRLEHELAVLDVAAGQRHLRDAGLGPVVLLGNSGGAGLFCFYQQQASLSPDERVSRTPGGRPVKLAEEDMPEADALVLLAPHPGQGRLLLGCIDPSVTDEADAYAIDSDLDMFDPRNGWRPPGEETRYAPDFLERYRAAQHSRVERLDAIARDMIGRRLDARRQSRDSGEIDRRGLLSEPITIFRTDADPRCWDLSLDPSDRAQGSVWNRDLLASNYGTMGFGRLCTAESWLSTWSGIASNAALEKTLPGTSVPTLIVEYTGDQSTFPGVIEEIAGWVKPENRTHVRVRGDHHGRPLAENEPPGRALAATEIVNWLVPRFQG